MCVLMHTCLYVCLCAPMCASANVYTQCNVCSCTHVHTCMYAHVHVCTCVQCVLVHVCIVRSHAYMCMCACMCIHVECACLCMCVCTRVYFPSLFLLPGVPAFLSFQPRDYFLQCHFPPAAPRCLRACPAGLLPPCPESRDTGLLLLFCLVSGGDAVGFMSCPVQQAVPS